MTSQSLPSASSPVIGELIVPGSKSETNRALVLAALADGPSTLRGVLDSRDSQLMISALRALGVSLEARGDALRVTPPVRFRGAADIDCGLAGTVMRFVPPVALLADGPSSFVGDPHASERPMGPLLDGLRQLGAIISADAVPFRMVPPASLGSEAVIDSSGSSQFVSGLMLIGALLPQGLTIRHTGNTLPSRPHIAMTAQMLRDRGVTVSEPDERTWVVAPGSIQARDTTIEPDLTNASVFLAAAAATGGQVTVPGWPQQSLQPGALFLEVAERMGATVEHRGDKVTVTGPSQLHGIDVDLTTASELTPSIAALGALAQGTTRVRGVAHIRGHETDRLAALVAELRKIGIRAQETDDGLTIEGGTGLNRAEIETYADHRMVHFAALVALKQPGITVTDLQCVSKTMPAFPQDWARLVG
ncbi:3-phosphoshikimate 1-carboxyvinyltransferase [Tessaracoccus sp. MC1756]|uniref:3-phosphoshikimate 1-carboxyvinyltransferase n=1 Tax=Tessaracoccus sp. MC1756 TaxID=2760311 RepID=UPI0015FECD20|nr:3-phosphoshikimate 1-carboxyvinyltransferase [Tessaracoccus sp. MC1756]MBB1510219.1 3-phosphoshikimate 1-carboxyvinyltransferase [Tessaracoccus sp. MC1756]